MADPKKLEPWLQYRFDRLVQARQGHIRQWDKEKERARQEIARLSSILASPTPRIRTQNPVPSSLGYAPGLG